MSLHRLVFVSVLSGLCLFLGNPAVAGDIQTRPIQFRGGKTVATLKGELKGRQTIDYLLHAKAGQTISITFKSSNASAYFNLLSPGSTGEALFTGATSGNQWTGSLPLDGEYRIRTYLYRNAARRHERAKFTLTVSTALNTPSQTNLDTTLSHDAKVKGTPYHATGTVPCSAGSEIVDSKQCQFGVIRSKPGSAEIHLTSLNGANRVLIFLESQLNTNNHNHIKPSKKSDIWLIEINSEERYQIPEAVINGG